ncbi:MAG: hypothetical protein JWP57_4443 [Spirosoma sp.]|nr:hypothetical protein [Spirosoma sp.]
MSVQTRRSVAAQAVDAPSDLVRQQADRATRMYLAGRENGQPDSLEAKRIIESVLSPSYDGRTLIELLQNGHDAHPAGTPDGRIAFRLDAAEGQHGVLYAANGGTPLASNTFESLCRVAMSTKRPDESIGNKGVGFKSVLNLSDGPELYSKAAVASGSFDGFCFRFARPEDFDEIAGRTAPHEPDLAAELRENVSALKTPVPLDSVPPAVAAFADWAVTVVRLPLRDDSALERTRDQLRELAAGGVPLHLFLPRLARIGIAVADADGEATAELRRDLAPLARTSTLTAHTAVLQDGSRYVLLQRRVAEATVKEAIAASAGRLPDNWQGWQGDAGVAIALPLTGDGLAQGRLYTYLPMGESAAATVPALMNAPFFPDVDRRDLQRSIPLNEMWFGELVELCAEALVLAEDGRLQLPFSCRLDLACWAGADLARLRDAVRARGHELHALRLVPALPDGATSVDAGWIWPGVDGQSFGPSAVVQHGAAEIADPALSPDRVRRLKLLAQGCGYAIVPTAEDLAGFAADVAASMAEQDAAAEQWAHFYDDLAAHRGLERYLPGRQVVAADGGGLANANSAGGPVTVYFAPGSDDDRAEGGAVPALVRDRLAFMRADIPFVDRTASGRRRRAGRVWLEEHGLVREYRTDALLDLLGQVMRAADPGVQAADLAEALEFAFRLWDGAARGVAADTVRRAGLLVPAGTGWTPAAGAVFGRGWGGPDQETDALLSRLIRDSAGASAELAALGERSVAPPAGIGPSAEQRPGRWREFLEALGVGHGLVPRLAGGGRLPGRAVNAPRSAHGYGAGLTPARAAAWREHAASHLRGRVAFETTEYTGAAAAAIPGQGDWDALDHRSRVNYAHLVVVGLESWPESAFEIAFSRYSDELRAWWPSPLAHWLASTAWVPQTTPGNRTEVRLERPTDAWWVRTIETPDFLPAQPPVLRSVAGRRAADRLRDCGVRIWDEPESAPSRLAELARIVDSQALESRTVAALAVRKANEAAWRDLEQLQLVPPPAVVASRRGELAAVALGEQPVYVPDSAGEAKEVLLAQTGQPLLPVKDLALGERLLSRYATGRNLRAASSADVRVRLDGQWADTAAAVPLAEAAPAWLPLLVLAVMEFKHRGAPPVTPALLRQAARSLGGSLVADGTTVTVFVDGHAVPTAAATAASFLVRADDGDRLVVARGVPATGLPEATVPALAELVGLPQMSDQLRLALYELRRRCGAGEPTAEDVAAAVGASAADVRELEQYAQGGATDWSAVVAVLALADAEAALGLREAAPGLGTAHDLRAWLVDRLAGTAWTADQIVEASGQRDMLDAARLLQVGLRRANAGLTALGLTPIRNAEGHRTQVRAYVAARRAHIRDRLRDAHVPVASDPAAMQEYLRLLELPGLDADPGWLDEYWEVPENDLDARVEAWLSAVAPPGLAPGPSGLPGVEELRETGRRVVTGFVRNAQVLVEAWLHRNAAGEGRRPPSPAEAIERITGAGLMDFGRLAPGQVLSWLRDNGHWPEGMLPTTSRADQGISDAEMAAARDRLARAREDARRRTTYVEYDGKTFSEDPEDLRSLAEAVRDQVQAEDLNVPVVPVGLVELALAGSPPPGGRERGGRASAPPPEKAKAIGLAGEVVVGEWLRQRFGLPPEVTWVSGYRNDVLGDGGGSDGHGYDFEAATPDGTYLVEVKSTTGADCQFSLHESEVRRAQSLEAGETYLVVMVNHVLDPSRRKITPLPNPLGRAGLAHFRVLGSALRLQFETGS